MISELKSKAKSEGFDAVRITSAALPDKIGVDLEAYIAAGHHGEMAWMPETLDRRKTPTAMWPEARSAIMLAMNYGQGLDAFARPCP